MKKRTVLYMALLFLFIGINQVQAKTYTDYSVGDVVKLSVGTDTTSEWIALENSDSSKDTIKLLKSTLVDGKDKVRFNSTWDNNYANSIIKQENDAYGNSLNLGDYLKEIRLIERSELIEIGCSSYNCKNAPSWVYSSNYWTQTPHSMQSNYADAYRVTTDTYISPSGLLDRWGLRPVIVVSKEAILNGYSNEEKEFDDIIIVCPDKVQSGEEFTCYIGIDKNVKKINFDLSIAGSAKINYSIKIDNWNEELPEVVNNDNDYFYENVFLTKKVDNENTELFSIIMKSEVSKENKEKTITLSNIELYDTVGDYQNIEKVEKTINISKYIEIVENPKTGNTNYKMILLFLISLGSIIIILTYKKFKNS